MPGSPCCSCLGLGDEVNSLGFRWTLALQAPPTARTEAGTMQPRRHSFVWGSYQELLQPWDLTSTPQMASPGNSCDPPKTYDRGPPPAGTMIVAAGTGYQLRAV